MPEPSPPPPTWPTSTPVNPPDSSDPSGSSAASDPTAGSAPPSASTPPPAPDLAAGRASGQVDVGPGAGDTPAWPAPGETSGPPPTAPPFSPGFDPSRDRGTPRRSGRRTGIVVAVVALAAVAGVVAALLGTPVGDDATVTGDDGSVASADPGASASAVPGDPVPRDDGDLAADVATAHRELFTAIDASERTMLALSAATPGATGDLDEDELASFEAESAEHVAELERIHDVIETMDTAGSGEVEAIREAYLAHLSDWIDWGRAVSSDPTLVDRPDARLPYLDAINFSADGFANSVERNLDRAATPQDVVDLADEIIERGFDSGDDGTEI